MVKEIIQKIVNDNEYVWEEDFSKQAHCFHKYCPSSIQCHPISVSGKEYYYLSYIPHFHKSTLYQGDPQCLPSFLQLVLYDHSGVKYFNTLSTQLHHSSSSSRSTFNNQLLNELQSRFMINWKETLHQTALSDFGHNTSQNLIDLINTYTMDSNGK